MAIPFSRTMRSLDADDFRGPRVVWTLAVIIIAAWTWWFFTAQIPIPGAPAADMAERTSPARRMWRTVRSVPQSTVPQDHATQ